jgi:hypothetical protein
MRQIVLALSLAALPLAAQWPAYVPESVPRLPNGKPNLVAAAPKTAWNTPDLSGVWEQYGEFDMPKYLINVAADLKPEELGMKPEGAALMRQRAARFSADHPGLKCLPSGIPEKDAVPAPVKIIQTPDVAVLLYESRSIFRQVFLDGRPMPTGDAEPQWQGYSTGRWEGDTLVVDTRGFREEGWLDMAGHPGSAQLHVTERFRRPAYGSLELEIIVDDPKYYSKPWVVREKFHLLPDGELLEHICEENNRDPEHIPSK